MRRCTPLLRLGALLACTMRRCLPLLIRLQCSPGLQYEVLAAPDQARVLSWLAQLRGRLLPLQIRLDGLLPCGRCGELGLVHDAKVCSLQAIQAWRDGAGDSRVQLVKQYFLGVAGGCPACVL